MQNLPPKTAPVLNREITNQFLRERTSAQRATDAFESLNRIVRMIENGEQIEPYRCMDLVVAFRYCAYWNYCENPKHGRRISEEVKRWQAATVRHPHTGAPIPLLDMTAPMADELNRLHSMFDGIDLEE